MSNYFAVNKSGKSVSVNTSGEWVEVDKDGKGYGYVNTVLASGSGYKAVPFYGKW